MNRVLKGLVSGLIAISIISAFSIEAYAIDDNGNSGGGSQGGQSGSVFTWTETQGGYRFSIVDKDLNQVSNTVDILYSEPSNYSFGGNRYTNSRVKGLTNSGNNFGYVLWDKLKEGGVIPGYPPLPVYYEGNTANAGGEEFKEFFLAGKNILSEIVIAPVYEKPIANNTNSNVNVSYGTSKPDKVDVEHRIDDMKYASPFLIESSPSYRADIRSTSAAYVTSQGYYSHARTIINSMTNVIAKYLSNQIKHGVRYNIAVQYMVSRSYTHAKDNSYTTAEFNYIYSSILSEALGFNWKLPTSSASIDNYIVSNTDVETIETVPLASDKGYADKILNYKDNGSYIFKFTNGVSLVNGKIADTINYNGYNVIVEPVFWFKPAAQNGGYPTYPVHGNYVYGTVSNIIDFYESNTQFGDTGGAYAPLTHTLGYACMYTSESYGGIKGFSDITGRKTTTQIANILDSKYGAAMHLYKTTVKISNDQVTGENNWENPAPPPDPTKLKEEGNYTKEYNIVKYYEDVYPDGKVEYVGSFYGANNPHIINIKDELNYKVKGWYTTTVGLSGVTKYSKYSEAYSNNYKIRDGNGTGRVKLKEDTGKNEKTLVVLLRRNVVDNPVDSPFNLSESTISKLLRTDDNNIYGKRDILVKYPALVKDDGDNRYSYSLIRANTNPNLEARIRGGAFTDSLTGNSLSGTVGKSGGQLKLSTLVYKTVIWRGMDIPTIASYKVDKSDNSVLLTGRYGTEPSGTRGGNGVNQVLLELGFRLYGDKKTYGAEHELDRNTSDYKGTVNIDTYRGDNKKETGDSVTSGKVNTTTPFGSETSINSYGYSVPGVNYLTFYPYIRMTYQDNTGKTKDTYPLSQWYSSIRPNRFVEVAWKSSSEENIEISSTQWSVHARATQGTDGWQGKNQVLPGGALYQLSIPKPVQLALVTWNPIVTEDIRNTLYNGIPNNEYSENEASTIHSSYVDQVKNTIEGYKIVQYVNGNVKAANAWTGTSVKIDSANKSLSSIGLTGVTTNDNKYRLLDDDMGDAANQGDIDITSSNTSTKTYFKVFASPEGNIYLAKSVGNLGAIKAINGTNLSGGSYVTVTKILGPSDTVANISKLTGDAAELEKRTSSVSNLLKVLERNTGNDKTASWNNSGHWYYEAFDGYITVRESTILSLGFKSPEVRTSAIDTALVGKSTGTADMFKTAILSQFSLDTTGGTVIANVNGKDIEIPNIRDMFKSKKFYIPNVSVSDLKN